MTMPGWADLEREMLAWADLGRPVSIWWRDDDAVADSAALRRMAGISAQYDVPLAIAVIPASLDASLPAYLRLCEAPITVCQHGFAHVDNALPPAKKCELDDGCLHQRLRQLEAGRLRLEEAFDTTFSPVLVPPWNRIAPQVVDQLGALGYAGLSTFAGQRFSGCTLPQNNCHVDLIDWRGSWGFIGEGEVLAALIGHLRSRRECRLTQDEVTGILSHHLVHDAACWLFLERLWRTLRQFNHSVFCSLDEVFNPSPGPL